MAAETVFLVVPDNFVITVDWLPVLTMCDLRSDHFVYVLHVACRAAMNIRNFEGLFVPLLPSKVNCLLRTFTCHTFHTMHMLTMSDDRMSHFQVLIVGIVMA